MGKKSKKKNYKSVSRPKPAADTATKIAADTTAKTTTKTVSNNTKKEDKFEPRKPFFVLAGMYTVSIAFLLIVAIATFIMKDKEDVWAVFLFIGLSIVPCLTFWELSYSTKIFGYDLRTKPVPEGIRPIRRGFHIAALILTNLCAFFMAPGIAIIWEEGYFGALIFGLLAFGLPAGYCWFKTFEYRLLKKSYQKYLKKTEEKKTKKK